MDVEKQGKWLLFPECHGKTRIWLREDTELKATPHNKSNYRRSYNEL